jgi:hypothetical protein
MELTSHIGEETKPQTKPDAKAQQHKPVIKAQKHNNANVDQTESKKLDNKDE